MHTRLCTEHGHINFTVEETKTNAYHRRSFLEKQQRCMQQLEQPSTYRLFVGEALEVRRGGGNVVVLLGQEGLVLAHYLDPQHLRPRRAHLQEGEDIYEKGDKSVSVGVGRKVEEEGGPAV